MAKLLSINSNLIKWILHFLDLRTKVGVYNTCRKLSKFIDLQQDVVGIYQALFALEDLDDYLNYKKGIFIREFLIEKFKHESVINQVIKDFYLEKIKLAIKQGRSVKIKMCFAEIEFFTKFFTNDEKVKFYFKIIL